MFAAPVVTLDIGALTRRAERLDFSQLIPDLNNAVEANVLPDAQARADSTINAEPGAHRRPTDWQTPKQRRWWFAVGIHLWQGRTGAVRQWKISVVRTPDGGQIVASNPTTYWPFVYGTPTLLQQRMHIGTWPQFPTYLTAEQAALAPQLRFTFARL